MWRTIGVKRMFDYFSREAVGLAYYGVPLLARKVVLV
jgi:hypothetical protein